jgi:Tol biopolymer transport system component
MTQPAASPPASPPDDRLDSWKEIAAYLDRDVTTVQRWERREGMPVDRHLHDRCGSVYAFRADLDAWLRSRSLRTPGAGASPAPAPASGPPPPDSRPSPAPVRRSLAWPSAAGAALAIGAFLWLRSTEYFWRSPIADARVQVVTDFDGVEQAAAVSRDGRYVAFLSDRDGTTDVWVTQVGSGESHNLTRGSVPELVNPSLRPLGFSPDGALVVFWSRRPRQGSSPADIGVWAVPTLGGRPKPYLEGAAELDWSADGARLAYHTTGSGDPMFVTDGTGRPSDRLIFTAPPGLHVHYPVWAPDGLFLYCVMGTLPSGLDIWRIRPDGGGTERITSHNARVSHPVLLDRRTLLYLAADSDGSGPWLYTVDVERRVPHQLTSGLEAFTSLAASADGHRLVLTSTRPRRTLWRLPIGDSPADLAAAVRIPLPTGTVSSPRLGPGYLLYVATTGTGDSLWKATNGEASELWRGTGARILGSPAIAPDGQSIAFSVAQPGQTLLHVMRADGTNARIVADTLKLQGAPAWSADARSITTAADVHGTPHLFRVPLEGGLPSPFVQEYALDPMWAPDGRFAVYSGPDIGTTFSLRAVSTEAAAYPLPPLTLTRGARHVAFLPRRHALLFLRGEIRRKDLWLLDLETGAERRLTGPARDFDVDDFDVSPDGKEVVLERVQQSSNVVLLDRPR